MSGSSSADRSGRVSRYRTIVLLIVVAILVTLGLGILERRTAPLVAQSPASPLDGQRGSPPANSLRRSLMARLGLVASALKSGTVWRWPLLWIAIGLVLFGVVAWALIRQFRRIEHKL